MEQLKMDIFEEKNINKNNNNKQLVDCEINILANETNVQILKATYVVYWSLQKNILYTI